MPPRKQPTTNTTTTKAKVATTTRTRPTRATADKTDELTATLATKLTISNPKGRQRTTETTTQRATSSRLRKEKATDGGSASDVTQLAQNLATGLSLGSQLKERTKEELCTDAMREVNSASRGLSSIVESGWKRSTSSLTPAQRGAKSNQPDRESQASGYAVSARSALQMLRELKPGDMDVERAASSLVGKLVASEMYNAALEVLSEAHTSLAKLYGGGSSHSQSAETSLLSLPLPSSSFAHDNNISLTLISNHLLYAIIAFSYNLFAGLNTPQPPDSPTTSSLTAFADTLTNTSTLLQWLPLFECLPPKHIDSVLTRAYTAITKASVLATCSSNEAKPMFRVRLYALHLLLHTSPSILRPTTFWDQTVKFTVAFVKDTASGSTSADLRAEVTKTILSTFDNILEVALRTRIKEEDRATWLSGSGFMGFCEYWMEFAKRANDAKLMHRISLFVRGTSQSPSSTSIVERTGSSADDPSATQGHSTSNPDASWKQESARISTILTQATAVLEQVTESGDDALQETLVDTSNAMEDAKPFLPVLYATENYAAVDDHKYADKVRRALERLRRAAVKALEISSKGGHGSSSITKESRHLVRTIVEKGVSVLDNAVQATKVAHVDMLTPALDSSFALARTALVSSNPLTYVQAYGYLAQANSLLCSAEGYTCDPMQLANYLRCLSGAFHNMGGTLYQGTQYSHAVRFLEQSCLVGEKALQTYREAGGSSKSDAEPSEDKDKQEAWAQLEEQMYRRWEILGVCHSKTGDRKMAIESFVSCVKAFPFSKPSFIELASSHSASAIFDTSPSLKHVAGIIDRLTYTGICDLLLHPRAVSLKSHFSQCYIPEDVAVDTTAARRAIAGIILERQIDSLDSCKWKEHGRKAIRSLLDEALVIYAASDMPIRRARVILKLLEYMHSSFDFVSGERITAEDLGREAELLLTRRDVGLDAALVQFRVRYRAILKLRLALLVHREAQTSQFSRVVFYAEEACSVLRSALSTAPRESTTPIHSPKVARTQPGRRVVIRGQTAASRLPTAKTRTTRITKTTVAIPVTPRKKRGRTSIGLTALAPPTVNQALPQPDDLPILINLLRSCAHLLGLLGQMVTKMHLLILARRICEKFIDSRPDDYVVLSIELAQEYVNLGKLGKAANIYHSLTTLAQKVVLPAETRVLLSLRFAESQAVAGNVLKSSSAYCEAYAASENLPEIDKGLPTTQRIAMRAIVLERAAVAASTFAIIQYSKDDPSAAINGLLQALRLWNRAVDTLSKVAPVSTPVEGISDPDNPFLADPAPDSRGVVDNGRQTHFSSPSKSVPRLPALDGIEWRVAHGLLVTLFALAQAYVARGSPREAEYFAQQAKDVAESLNTPAMIGRALARIGEIYLHLHQVEDSHASLVKAANLVAGTAGPDAAEIRRLRAEHSRLHSDGKEAQQLYEEAMSMLEELDSVFAALDGQAASPRKSLGGLSPKSSMTTGNPEALAPSVLMAILRQNIRLLHEEGEEYATLLERFRALSSTSEAKAEENALLAKLSLENVYTRFQADMFLNSLSESTITLPMGMVSNKPTSSGGQEVLGILNHAEKLFWSDLAHISRRGNVFDVRDAAISLTLIRAFQASLGGTSGDSPILAARLLDMSAAITLQREVLEVVQHKFPGLSTQDDLQWPLMTPNGSVIVPPKHKIKGRFVSFESDDEPDGLQEADEEPLKKYWDMIGNKYKSLTCDAANLAVTNIDGLPPTWTIVSVSITEDHNTLFVTRQRPGKEPLMFCIPLKERRENVDDDDEYLGFEHAIHELKEIIRLSDEGTRQAQHVRNDRSARQAWWADRTALDERMKDLLENIEFCWFGAFKTILNEPIDYSSEVLKAFRTQIERVFQRSTPLKYKRQRHAVHLNDALLECFASLSPKCRDEELADLVYFILDLYQFHGTPIAAAEVDVDEVVIDLRAVLEEHTARCQGKVRPQKDAHTFLVLDKNIAGVPWESLPVLRGRSVSRIPSVDFLLDRVELCQQTASTSDTQKYVDRVVVDPRKAYYVLNPSGDLKNTEGRFSAWLKDMTSMGWEGIVGRAPSELQLSNALTKKDLVIYFGHGGAEQYIRSHKLRHLPRCAATMLWGCSSGALKEMGDFDRVGTPYNYMLSGCPTLVANLWDVTDRDIDKFSQAVFDKMHLSRDQVANWTPERGNGETSIVAAVALSRDVCKLKYLTGAAPVVYGIPFYL